MNNQPEIQWNSIEASKANIRRTQAKLDFYYEHRDARGDYAANLAFDKSMKLDKAANKR
jgi:hypothetical protein